MNTPTADRTKLDALLLDAAAKRRARDSIDRPGSPEWLSAHKLASDACLLAYAERKRLWQLDRWGSWMSANDMLCAGITGEL